MLNSNKKTRVLDERRRHLIKAGGGLMIAGLAAPGKSQTNYPNKPIRMVIPFPPGGPTDIVGRIVAHGLSESFGQTVTIENKPGASGMIGADIVAKASPDGYTLLVNVSAHVVNPALYKNMPHDPIADFTPITNLAYTPIQLVVSANLPVYSVADLIKLIKSQPGRHNFASSSPGAPGHLMGELFKQVAKLDVVPVPYKGSAPALTDVIGGQITFMFDSMPSSINLVKSGRLRSLGVSSPERLAILPDVPTFAQQNFPTLNLTTWYGMWGPAKMPSGLTEQVYAAVSKVLSQADIRKRIQDALAQPVGDTPEQFKQYCAAESQRYASIVKAAGIKVD
ncbi:Bug family tripartite tricarboxylate transporter substrate binding protein [Sheuella amnicola]|nr:tripartite tricarboxylate transporter substrate binding protein [Sheuella amnicola]